MRKKQKRSRKATRKLETRIFCGTFIFIVIAYMLFVTFYIDPKWDARMERELVPIEQVIDEGNQKEDGYRRERKKEKEEGEKLKCPDNYGEMIGGEYNEQ